MHQCRPYPIADQSVTSALTRCRLPINRPDCYLSLLIDNFANFRPVLSSNLALYTFQSTHYYVKETLMCMLHTQARKSSIIWSRFFSPLHNFEKKFKFGHKCFKFGHKCFKFDNRFSRLTRCRYRCRLIGFPYLINRHQYITKQQT